LLYYYLGVIQFFLICTKVLVTDVSAIWYLKINPKMDQKMNIEGISSAKYWIQANFSVSSTPGM